MRPERFEQLVDPGVPIPPMASAIHGIKDEHVHNAPSFSAMAPDLEAFIGVLGPDRTHHRLRSRRAAARVRAGRAAVAPAADARRARPCRAGAADACPLRPRAAVRVALHRDYGPAHRHRRRDRHRPAVHGPGAAAAPARHPHPCRGGGRVAADGGAAGPGDRLASPSRRSRRSAIRAGRSPASTASSTAIACAT